MQGVFVIYKFLTNYDLSNSQISLFISLRALETIFTYKAGIGVSRKIG